MAKLFSKAKVLDEEQQQLLVSLARNGTYTKAGVSGYSAGKNAKGGKVNEDVRKCLVHSTNVWDWPDVNHNIMKLAKKYSPECTEDKFFCKEMQILHYDIGGKFDLHKDTHNYETKPRFLTTITLLDRTDDLEGGDLIVYGPNIDTKSGKATGRKVMFEPFETVVFYSDYYHQCTPLTKGKRTILVTWIHEWERSKDFWKKTIASKNL